MMPIMLQTRKRFGLGLFVDGLMTFPSPNRSRGEANTPIQLPSRPPRTANAYPLGLSESGFFPRWAHFGQLGIEHQRY